MRYILGIDQGATKTMAVVADVNGNILGVGHAGGGYHAITGMDHAMGEIKKAVKDACQMADIQVNQWAAIGAGLTGADFDYEYILLEEALEGIFNSDYITVKNDSIVAFHGGSWKDYGGVICAGTGLNCAIKSPNGAEFIYGYTIQDRWQGGASIGKRAMDMVFESSVGIQPPTLLTQRIIDYYQVDTVDTLLHQFIMGELSNPVKNLVKIVDDCTILGDPCATLIMTEFAQMCAKYITTGFKRFEMLDLNCDLVLSGGVFKCKNTVLRDTILNDIHAKAPNVSILDAKYEPVVGGVVVGLRHIMAGADHPYIENIQRSAPKFGLVRLA